MDATEVHARALNSHGPNNFKAFSAPRLGSAQRGIQGVENTRIQRKRIHIFL